VAAVAIKERADVGREATQAGEARLFEPGGVTLEDIVLEAWEDLASQGRADCPVCGDSMTVAGGCRACGSELA
jgi:tRNA(Ile2) C34 agmatinyltransferase TiaS